MNLNPEGVALSHPLGFSLWWAASGRPWWLTTTVSIIFTLL